MKYRELSATGDYQFGRGGIFLTDSPHAVAQAIRTRLALWTNEWFLDAAEGTPYEARILGYTTQGTRDLAIKQRISETPGVLRITSYSSSVGADRKMATSAVVETIYGATTITFGT